ncbi:hypothetical protein BDF14DRAFT_1861093 [Spinellus fusiger]|nr:hypothetical protein BDF14DRAFT_1861093 [Spinellus fusiger]
MVISKRPTTVDKTIKQSSVAASLTERPGALKSWTRLLVYCIVACLIARYFHYRLPAPKTHRNLLPPQKDEFSEYNAVETMSYLSDTIGYRLVGTAEEQKTFEYLHDMVQSYKQNAQGILHAPKFDIWTQQESGSHRFDILDKMVLKQYTNITNIIVRLSCPLNGSGDRSCEKNAVLMNSHFDTAIGSPGASDDGSGTAVMLELIRVLSQRDWRSYKNSIVFLFNGAEETLQDASHMFITKHELKDSIRTVVNIDSCGTTGTEILFQANAREMVEAYKQAPYPHGTVLANDVFRTGLILSDTDFRQFVQYGNLTGMDMAIYKNSYLYHTHLDTVKHLSPGSIQHLGENTLAIVNYLALNTTLEGMEQTSDTVFFDVQGLFFVSYSWQTALILQSITIIASVIFFIHIVQKTSQSSPYRTRGNILTAYAKSIVSIYLSLAGSLFLPITVALFITSSAIERNMCWFSREWYPFIIFGPVSFIGSYGVQYLTYLLPGPQHVDMEYGVFISLLMTFVSFTFIATYFSIASSYLLWLFTIVLLFAAAMNEFCFTTDQRKKIRQPKVHSLTYLLSVFPVALLYNSYTYFLIDIFVPLTGRMGVETPVDSIISILFGMVTFLTTIPILAHVHRFGKAVLAKVLFVLLALQGAVLVVVLLSGGSYGGWAFPYDDLHPKRIFVQHLKNLTSGEISISIAQADRGPHIQAIVETIEHTLGVPASQARLFGGASDWDVVHPFGAFLGGYTFDSEPFVRSRLSQEVKNTPLLELMSAPFPSVAVHNDVYDPVTGIRSFTVLYVAPTYIWNIVNFDGHITQWDIEGQDPEDISIHYIIRHISGYGSDGWKFNLAVKVPEAERPLAERGEWKMRLEFTGMERENFPGTGKERLLAGVGVLAEIRKSIPAWTAPAWLSAVVQVWHI